MNFIPKIFHLLKPPVFQDDEEKSRNARTLNFILIAIMLLVAAFSIVTLFLPSEPNKALRIIIEFVLVFWTFSMLLFVRHGYVRQAAFLLTLTLWVVISAATYLGGGFRGSIMSSYYGIVLIACLVLGTRTGSIFAFLSAVFTAWLVYADMNSLLPPKTEYSTQPLFWSEFTSVLIFMVVVIGLIINDLKKALEITRKNAKELETAAIQANLLADKAEQANNMKSGLISRISHELRTPVSVILPLAEMLNENIYGELNDSQKKAIKRISSNSIKLEKLIKELLDQSQIESGQIKLNLENFSPAEMARALYLDCLTLTEKRDIKLNLEIDETLPAQIMGDEERTEAVLRNLIINAIKYTEKGQVDIRIQHIDAAHWGFQVQDTGVGISKEEQQYIFNAFHQIDQTAKLRRGGVGLGLSIVYNLVVKAMGGTIDLTSELGIGSTFTVILPIEIPNSNIES